MMTTGDPSSPVQTEQEERMDSIRKEESTSPTTTATMSTDASTAEQPQLTCASSFSSVASTDNNKSAIMASALAERRAKRQSEQTLQQLLRDAQTRFHSLQEENQLVASENRQLQEKLQQVQLEEDENVENTKDGHAVNHDDDDDHDDDDLDDDHDDLDLHDDDDVGDEELSIIKSELHKARHTYPNLFEEYCRMEADLEQTWEQNRHGSRCIGQLETQVQQLEQELAVSKQTEHTLKKSLREALNLLQPLQLHLENAEKEKKLLERKVKKYKTKWISHKQQRRFLCSPNNANDGNSVMSEDTDMLTNNNNSTHSASSLVKANNNSTLFCEQQPPQT